MTSTVPTPTHYEPIDEFEGPAMAPRIDGRWIYYEDYEALRRDLDTERKARREYQEQAEILERQIAILKGHKGDTK